MKETILSFWLPNLGYRMLHALHLNVFPDINIQRTYRLWKGLRFGRVKRYSKKRTGTWGRYAAAFQNDVWMMDIIHDCCMNGTKLRILSIVDASTRECLALEVSKRINARRLGVTVGDALPNKAAARFSRCDNGAVFFARSTAMLHHEAKWSARFIQPGKPWQKGYIESFHSTLGRDPLDVEVFFNLLDAQLKSGINKNGTKRVRPHSSLGYKAPAEVATTKAGTLMVPLGYQMGADQHRVRHYFMSEECPGNNFAFGSIRVLAKFAAVAASATPVTISLSLPS